MSEWTRDANEAAKRGPEPRLPRFTLLFRLGQGPSMGSIATRRAVFSLDADAFGSELARIRDSEVKLDGWEDAPDLGLISSRPESQALFDELGFERRTACFDDYVVQFDPVSASPSTAIARFIRFSKIADEELSELEAHDVFMTGTVVSGPPDPVRSLMACLDVARALEDQGLVGMTLDNSLRALAPRHIESFRRVPDDPRFDLLSSCELTVNHVPLIDDEVVYWLTCGQPLWGLPEFVVPLPRAVTPREAAVQLRALFMDAIEQGRVVEEGQTLELDGRRYLAATFDALPANVAHHADGGSPTVVYVLPEVEPLLTDAAISLAQAERAETAGEPPPPPPASKRDAYSNVEPLEAPSAPPEGAPQALDQMSPEAQKAIVETAEVFGAMSRAVVIAALRVASADGEFDPKEQQAFARALGEHLKGERLFEMVAVQIATDLVQVMDMAHQHPLDPIAQVREFAETAGRLLSKREALRARKAVYFVAHDVAAASGKGLFRPGIGKREEQALAQLSHALGFE